MYGVQLLHAAYKTNRKKNAHKLSLRKRNNGKTTN